MAEMSGGADLGPLSAQVAAITAAIGQSPQFVTDQILTVAQAMSSFAPSAGYRGKYVRVSDLYGAVDGVMRCGYDGTSYFWQPTSTDFGKSIPTGNMTVTAHGFPTSILLTGTISLGVTQQITLDPTNAWPGAVKEIKSNLSTMLGGLNIGVLGLGTVVGLVVGGYTKYTVDRQGGALTWIRLV